MDSVSTATKQGPRTYQEDRFCVHKRRDEEREGILLAVFDGHGGSRVAELCKEKFHEYFSPVDTSAEGITEALRNAISKLSEETLNESSGTTLSVTYIFNNQAFVAVIGDSPVMIVDSDGKTIVSPEHNVRTNTEERNAAIARGGEYVDGYIWSKFPEEGLQMSRALGDARLGNIINHEPETYLVHLGPQSVVVLCTDGVLDPSHKNTEIQIKELMTLVQRGASAINLLSDAEKRGLRDNATLVLWRM